jgi:hypothetical protein
MGKKDEQNTKPVGNGNNRVQGFVFGINLQGTEEVVTEGIKAFTQALASSGLALTPASATRSVLVAGKPNGSSAPAAAAAAPAAVDVEDSEEVSEAIEPTEIESTEEETELESNGNGSAKKRNYSFRRPDFMHELDLSTAKKPLADYVQEKGGDGLSLLDKYVVVAVWLKEFKNVDEFTIHHIYTAFDNLGWKAQIPVDHSQPLRDLKGKKHFVTKEKGAKGYKVSWQGTQYVENLGAQK